MRNIADVRDYITSFRNPRQIQALQEIEWRVAKYGIKYEMSRAITCTTLTEI